MFRKFLFVPIVFLSLGLILPGNLWGEEKKDSPTTSPLVIPGDSSVAASKQSQEERIQQALAKPIELTFMETPLEKVVETLHDKLHIPVLLDRKYLDDVGINGNAPITFSISNVSAKTALALMLHDLGLKAIIQHEVILITTPEEEESQLETRVYDVADLVCQTDSTDEEPDFNSLILLVTTCVCPTSWDTVGGPGSIVDFQSVGIKAIVILQTQEINEKVADLLTQLRSMYRGSKPDKKAAVALPGPGPQLVDFKPKASPFTAEEEKIRRILSQRLTLQFKEASLRKITEYIHNNTNLQVVISHKVSSLEFNADTLLMTVDLVGLDLSAALDSMLQEHNLDWTIYKGTLIISSPEDIEDNFYETKTYDVSDLPAFRIKQGETIPDYERLIKTIITTIMPTSWDAVGGPATITRHNGKGIQAIVVNHQWVVHDKIYKLLSDLRKTRKYPLTKDEIEKLPLYQPPKSDAFNPSAIQPFSLILPPMEPDAKRDAVVQGNNQFAFALYSQLREQSQKNLLFSPYSLSTAFAMAYAGARGETAAEIAKTMRFTLPQEEMPLGFQSLLDALPDEKYPGYQLVAANRLWCQKNISFRELFLQTLHDRFHSELGLVDFQQPEISRKMINDWVEEKTNHRIKELFGPGSIYPQHRMVLTNAIYFKGYWAHRFNKSSTQSRRFYIANKSIGVQMMYQVGDFHYGKNAELQILEMTYLADSLSMVILLPIQLEELDNLEKSLTAEKFKEWSDILRKQKVSVSLPRFNMNAQYDLLPSLKLMGMKNAFDSKAADFTGIIANARPLWLDAVVHDAYIQVDEEGTKGTAATGIGGFGVDPQIPIFIADHLFIFLIRDTRTGSIFFLGRMMEPWSN